MPLTNTNLADSELRKPGSQRWLWFTAGLTIVLCLAIAVDLTPLLRGPAPYPPEWQWGYRSSLDVRPAWLLAPLLAGALIGGWVFVTRRQKSLKWWALIVLAALVMGFWLSVNLTSRSGLSIVARTLNPAYFSVFEDAVHVKDLHGFLNSYVTGHDLLSYRQRSHPPGNTVFFWLIVQTMRSITPLTNLLGPVIEAREAALPGWITAYNTEEIIAGMAASMVVPALEALAVVPLYALARRLSGERAARLSAIFYAFTPALALFIPVVDGVYALLSAASLLLVVSGMLDGRRWQIVLGGLLTGVGTFMSFSFLPVGLMLGLVIIFNRWRDGRIDWKGLLLDELALGTGAALIWLGAWLYAGLDPVGTFRAAMSSHENSRNRSYWLWLLYNPYDVLLFAGVPTAVMVVMAVNRLGKQTRQRRPLSPAARVFAAFLLAMGAMLISGMLRGETARTLLYVTPVMALFAADQAERRGWAETRPAILFAALLAVQTVVFNAALNVYH